MGGLLFATVFSARHFLVDGLWFFNIFFVRYFFYHGRPRFPRMARVFSRLFRTDQHIGLVFSGFLTRYFGFNATVL